MRQSRFTLGSLASTLLTVILLATGCSTFVPPVIPERATPLAIDDPRASAILEAYLVQAKSRSALRGSARVLLEGPDFKLDRPQRIVVERPGRLRFEIIGLFDQLAALLATDGHRYAFYDAGSGEIARGMMTPSLLWDLAKIDLDSEEVVGVLLGAPSPSLGSARAAVWLESGDRIALAFAWPEDGGEGEDPACPDLGEERLMDPDCFLTTAALGDGGEVFVFDAGGRLAEMRARGPGGELRFRAFFDDYEILAQDDPSLEFPRQIEIRSSAVDSVARFRWKRVMFAQDLSDRLFTIPERSDSGRDG